MTDLPRISVELAEFASYWAKRTSDFIDALDSGNMTKFNNKYPDEETKMTAKKRAPDQEPIKIPTPWGDVTESARLQAAINMRSDPAKRAEVERLLGEKLGNAEAGMAEAKRRYPESYEDA